MKSAEDTLRRHIRRLLNERDLGQTLPPEELRQVENDVLTMFQHYGSARSRREKEDVRAHGREKVLNKLLRGKMIRSKTIRSSHSR
jgi:hypothetical protein